MTLLQTALLLTLSAIWGGSFIFMRHLAPILGPVWTTGFRLLIAGTFLVALLGVIRIRLDWRRNIGRFLVIGIVNAAVPFLLFSFAALYLPASVSVILNSLAPLFGALFSAIWLNVPLTVQTLVGLALGTGGVAVVSSLSPIAPSPMVGPAIAACVLATVCYGLSSVYIKKQATDIPPKAMAAGSQLSAGLTLVPFMAIAPAPGSPTPLTAVILIAFGILCSAVAFLIYYKLLAEAGPTKALTVTFLMPVFGILWGFLILGERIAPSMLLGAALVLAGIWLITAPAKKRGAVNKR